MRRKKDKSNKVRITLDLTQGNYKRLEALVSAADAGSKANLLRQALQVCELLYYRAQAGYRLFATRGDETVDIPDITQTNLWENHRTTTESSKKVRITVDLTETTYERLKTLVGHVNTGSNAELLRRVLQVYEVLSNRLLAGYRLFAAREDERIAIDIPGITQPLVGIEQAPLLVRASE